MEKNRGNNEYLRIGKGIGQVGDKKCGGAMLFASIILHFVLLSHLSSHPLLLLLLLLLLRFSTKNPCICKGGILIQHYTRLLVYSKTQMEKLKKNYVAAT